MKWVAIDGTEFEVTRENLETIRQCGSLENGLVISEIVLNSKEAHVVIGHPINLADDLGLY